MQIRRALVSVWDKSGVAELGLALRDAGVEVLSTGGTAAALREAGVDVVDVSDHTGSPEGLGGRVKTLHPRVHGGILFKREDEAQVAEAARLDMPPIDLVVVNLYPFRATVAGGAALEEACEQIDIGGPTMLRSAAKNWPGVAVLCDPTDYATVTAALASGEGLDSKTRLRLSAKVFAHTAAYDSAVAAHLRSEAGLDGHPDEWTLGGRKVMDLRYGENPHQDASFYSDTASPEGLAAAEILQGKALSYNNLLDTDGCLRLLEEFPDELACMIIKHTNPCGAATSAQGPADAYRKAVSTDPVSYFGGIVGFTVPVDGETAALLTESFLEVIVAPDFTEEARLTLARKKRLRVLRLPEGLLAQQRTATEVRRVRGGLLAQDPDSSPITLGKAEVVTKRQPTAEERRAMAFAWRICRNVKSNAIVYAGDGQLVGVGAGQMSRIDAARIAADRAVLPVPGTVAASDAFFPFRDGVDVIAAAGATAIVQPGGSIKDKEVIAAADEHGLAMILTGQRHFRH
jgi:phosphoribosylaminoimidazolecarboxamide formyltransferase/IMP cyclohydrolase